MRAWKLGMFTVFSIFVFSGLAFADNSWTPLMAINATPLAGKSRNFPSQLVAQRAIKASSAQRKEQQARMSPVCAPDSLPNPTMGMRNLQRERRPNCAGF